MQAHEQHAIYSGKPEDIGIVAFFSGGASSAKAIHERWPLKAGYTDNSKAGALGWFESHEIPVIVNDMEKFYANSDQPNLKDMDTRRLFDRAGTLLLDDLMEVERFKTDIIIASGYMKKLTAPVIKRFPVFNVHPADLASTDEHGSRKYTGDRAVLKALRAGENETRSTIHLMSEEPDQGPILVRSKALPVEGMTEEIFNHESSLEAFAAAHQEKMKRLCDVPAFVKAVELISEGHVSLDYDKQQRARLWIDNHWNRNGYAMG
ncbi:MAG: hypothetical protein HYS81_01220 [Candidatus Aenigmatarchaeota archaeon]|nr:MAG: hypothetical protein HYS81_01220 [Candidatus Aenigmarchaeota archaeon]